MLRNHAYLQSLDSYVFHAEIDTRYSDLDPQVHINNVAVASIYEECRSRFLRWLVKHSQHPLEEPHRLIAAVNIDYLAQIYYPSTLQVAAGIFHISQRSYRIAQAIFQDGRCAGLCETVVVHSDSQQSRAISPTWRQVLDGGAIRATATNTALTAGE